MLFLFLCFRKSWKTFLILRKWAQALSPKGRGKRWKKRSIEPFYSSGLLYSIIHFVRNALVLNPHLLKQFSLTSFSYPSLASVFLGFCNVSFFFLGWRGFICHLMIAYVCRFQVNRSYHLYTYLTVLWRILEKIMLNIFLQGYPRFVFHPLSSFLFELR
jgi:hypothetical protein